MCGKYRVKEARRVLSLELLLLQLLVLDGPLVAVGALYEQLLILPLHTTAWLTKPRRATTTIPMHSKAMKWLQELPEALIRHEGCLGWVILTTHL